MPTAELDGRRLSYVRRGSGEPLLLIMGMAGHVGLWGEPFLTALERDFEIVAFDNRGIGESTDVAGEWSITDLAADAVAVLDAVGWDSAHVMGISLGGMIAQELVLQHPERVRRLVLGCTYSGGEGSSLLAPGPMRMMEAMNSGNAEHAFRAGYEANLSPSFVADESHWTSFRAVVGSTAVPVPVALRQAQAAFVHDTSTRLPSVTAPTLVITGTADAMLVYANSIMIASLIPGATVKIFDDVGHLFWWERPDETADAIRAHCLS